MTTPGRKLVAAALLVVVLDAVAMSGELAFLLAWPPAPAVVGLAAGAAAVLVLWGTRHMIDIAQVAVRLTAATVMIAVVCVLVAGGLGHRPAGQQQGAVALSLLAASVAVGVGARLSRGLTRTADRYLRAESAPAGEFLRTFGAHLTRALPLDELLLQLAENLKLGLASDAVEVWTGSDGVLTRTASVPERAASRLMVSPAEEQIIARAGVCGPAWVRVWLPTLIEPASDRRVRVAPISHGGRVLGLLFVDRAPSEPDFDTANGQMLVDVARQVAGALYNAQLDSALQATLGQVREQTAELRASRARVVVAADRERRRIEQDLHDGAQQHLVNLGLKLNLFGRLRDRDADAAQLALDEMAVEVDAAVDELRRLAHGIYPPLLVNHGLAEAVRAAGRRFPTVVRVEAGEGARYAAEVEAAVYFCCTEALQNATRHGGADTVTVGVWEEEGALFFRVSDDGAGFVPSGAVGMGLLNMRDRVGAVGGTLEVESRPGAGTEVTGRVPLTERA